MKYHVVKYGRRGGEEIVMTREFTPNETGDLAIRFAHHFAIVAGDDGGEDSAGRAKLRLQTVEEVVQRSCDLAEKLTEEMRKRGWILDLPEPKAPDLEPDTTIRPLEVKKPEPPPTPDQPEK